jgi:hypothetical protein
VAGAYLTGVLTRPDTGRKPVELAVVQDVMDGFGPEMYLGFAFYRPDGGCNTWNAWTEGGEPLGDQVDACALAAGLDAADWLHIGDRHATMTYRGRVRIEAYPLRPILADVQGGERGPQERRANLRRVIDAAAAHTGQVAVPGLPRWPGFGPRLLNRRAAS